jgi:hypothetical protein
VGCYQLILYAVEGDVLSLPAEPNSRALNVPNTEAYA